VVLAAPPVLRVSVEALTNAPLSVVAQVAKKNEASLIEDLKDAGFEVKNADQTIDDLSLGDRRQKMNLLATIFEEN
jgi:predicted transcriptional regulator